MKSKYAPYILVPLVIFIWGLIFYRIYQAMQGEEDSMPPKRTAAPIAETVDATDTSFKLQLAYDDPFLKENELITLDKSDNYNSTTPLPNDWQTQDVYRPNARVLERPPAAPVQQTSPTIAPSFPTVIFQGVQIFENDTVAILKVDGRFYPNVRTGQAWGDLRLVRITRDSVVMASASARKAFYR